jgi:hypothetical protein
MPQCTAKCRRCANKRLMHCNKDRACFGMTIVAQITSDDVLDRSYEWLCRRRRDYSANSDVWALRRDWARQKEQIKDELHAGSYRFSLLTRIGTTIQSAAFSSLGAFVRRIASNCSRRCSASAISSRAFASSSGTPNAPNASASPRPAVQREHWGAHAKTVKFSVRSRIP